MSEPAYLLLVHNDAQHFGRLVRALEGDIYVHVDAKACMKDFEAVATESVTFVKARHKVAWAGISMVDALLSLVRQALLKKEQYSHLVFLTGSDYPIKSARQIRDFFEHNQGRELIRYIDMRESQEHYLKQVTRQHFLEPIIPVSGPLSRLLDKGLRKIATCAKLKNKWAPDVVPYFGYTWSALTPACCEYIVEFHDANPWFYEMNKRTMAVDEHYFHTIIGNSSFALAACGHQVFEGRGLWRLVNFHLICPSLKKWYDLGDLGVVRASNQLFVRKVNSTVSKSLLDAIDSLRLNQEASPQMEA